MTKFTHEPDSLASLAGCAFWLVFVSGAMTLLFAFIAALFRKG